MTHEEFNKEVAVRRSLYEAAKAKGDRMGMRYWADSEMWFVNRYGKEAICQSSLERTEDENEVLYPNRVQGG